MSAIGFSPRSPNELDQLREAYRSLNDVTRNLASAQKCLQKEDLRMAEHHLRAAEWHAAQAKQRIAAVGQQKSEGRGVMSCSNEDSFEIT
jgi:outer membrane murein-binding lipoprotein Lpp